jgi:signal transduction histidine kinase
MSLKRKLIINLNIIILIGVLFIIFLGYFKARDNIREDINSSIDLAEFAIGSRLSNRPNSDNLTQSKFVQDLNNLKKLHHLKIELLDAEGKLISETSDKLNTKIQPPLWFKRLFDYDDHEENFIRIVNIHNQDRNIPIGAFVIKSNLDYDHQTKWVEFLGFLEVFIFTTMFLNLSILIIFTQTLVPINNIINALTAMSQGRFNVALKKIPISELETIRFHLNKVMKKLKLNDQAISKLNQEILDVQEREKIMISHDLHDHLAQDLASIQVQSRAGQLSKTSAQKNKVFDQVIQISQSINESIREIIKKMNLSMIDELGFQEALEDLIKQSFTQLKLKKTDLNLKCSIIPKKLHTDFYRITQETLTNIKKHASPSLVKIHIFADRNYFLFLVENDGMLNKFKSNTNNGIGLLGIQQRVKKYNGIVEIKSQKNTFRIKIKVPKKNLA